MPPTATPEAPPENTDKTYRMKLLDSQFLSEFEGRGGPRLPAGAVLDVDTNTAVRWLDRGIAVYASKDATTLKDARRARLLARLEALEAEDDDVQDDSPPGVFGVPQSLAVRPTAEVRRRGRPPRAPIEADDAPAATTDGDQD